MQFCSACGKPVALKIPPGDSLMRHVCESCGTIHYQNPRLVVGCLPIWNGEILICKRAIEPAYGKWTLPAGFMENGEDLAEGAIRETREEANAVVRIRHLQSVFSIPHIHQVHVFFLADLIDGTFGSGPESLEVKLVKPADIPWPEIAFGSVRFALEKYLGDPDSTCAHIESFKRP